MLNDLMELLNPDFPNYFQGPLLFVILLAVGLIVGIISGLFGVGGGFILVPLMNVFLGIPYEISVGSALASTFGTTSVGFLKHSKMGNALFQVILFISCGSVVGVILGDSLQDGLKSLTQNPDDFTVYMHTIYLILLFSISAVLMVRPAKKANGKISPIFQIGPKVIIEHDHEVGLIWLLLLGILVGLLAGLLGIGGGVFLFPLLILIVGLTPHEAVRTSLGIVVFASFFSIIKKGLSSVPKISLPIILVLLLSSILGVRIGSWMCGKFHAERLKKYFSFVILLAFAIVLIDLLRRVFAIG